MKLLIVDDSMVIRKKIEREMALQGVTVILQASNGEEAVKCFKEHRPQVVTMDLTMPEMDGVECVKQLVKIDSDVMILVVSALADKATAIQAIKNGARGFLCKPFTEGSLNKALTQMIEDANAKLAV